jgi:hypothetical protein
MPQRVFHLFDSSGTWIAFRIGKYVYDTSGNWIGWMMPMS